MNSSHIIFLFGLFVSNVLFSQNISGVLPQLANQEIRLSAFVGLKNDVITSSFLDSLGNFQMGYSKKDYGVGYLISNDNKLFIVILNGEDIELKGNSLADTESIKVLKGNENQSFDRYAKEHPKREQALSAWKYLQDLYANDSLFFKNKKTYESIIAEENRIKTEDAKFVSSLPKDSYVRWFLPMRRLVSDAPIIVKYRPEELDATIESFRNMDYSDERLYRSGLFKESLENHFLLIENSGKPLESVFQEMNTSIDRLLSKLVGDTKKLNEVSNFLFDLLEQRSLYTSSQYLAIKLLNDTGCTLETDLSNQLEIYRAMKTGNTASEINFEKANFLKTNQAITSLSDVKSPYTLVVFGASWCPKCTEELPEIAKRYSKWNEKGIEVVFISLDENRTSFESLANDFPFISYSDLKKWNSPIVKDFYVSGTPTLFLLDKNRKILIRPNSVAHLEAWMDAFIPKN
jgi:thiol-disulfide isomerase/thioredoxin